MDFFYSFIHTYKYYSVYVHYEDDHISQVTLGSCSNSRSLAKVQLTLMSTPFYAFSLKFRIFLS